METSSQYFGTNTSLYSSLDDQAIVFLELAIKHRTFGSYDKARSIFTHELAKWNHIPVVLIEDAELSLQQGRFREIWNTLNGRLEDLKQLQGNEHRNIDLDAPEYRLMSMLLALAALHYKGILEPALKEIHRTRVWLRDMPVEEYTDVQVTLIPRFRYTSMVVTMNSNFDATEDYYIPRPTERQIPHQGLTDLRKSLMMRRMMTEAMSIFRVEFRCLPPEERLEAMTEFRDTLKTFGCFSEARLLWAEADLCEQIASDWGTRDEPDKGKICAKIQEGEDLLEKWCKSTGYQEKETLRLSLSLRHISNNVISVDDPLKCFEESTRLLQLMQDCGDARVCGCMWTAAEAARHLALQMNQEKYLLRFFELHHNMQAYQQHVSGNLLEMVIYSHPIYQHASRSNRCLREILEWVDSFFSMYPTFRLPQAFYDLHSLRVKILGELHNNDPQYIEKSRQAMDEVWDLLPKRFGPLIGVRQAHSGTSTALGGDCSVSESDRYLLDNHNDLEEDNFWSDWYHIIGNEEKMTATALRLLRQWMIEDLQDGTISAEEVSRAILVPINESLLGEQLPTDFLVDQLKMEFPAQFIDILCGPIPCTSHSWKATYKILSTWLKRPSRSTRNGRDYLRVVLYDIRIKVLRHQRERILEIATTEEVLALIPEVRRAVQKWLRTTILIWHGYLAAACLKLCYEGLEGLCDEASYQYLDKGQYHCQKAIDGYREIDNMHAQSLHHQLRMQAQFCLIQIHRLVSLSADSMNKNHTELSRLQDVGLKLLEEVDAHHREAELEITWSNDLEGLQNRQRAAKYHQRWFTAQLAVLLLHTGNPVPDETTRIKMWEWVQRYKAQALASTIGLKSASPPALITRILVSDECRPLYQKMLDLQSQIFNSSPENVMYLRQELRVHVTRMRKMDLLSRLLDFHEGKRLTAEDLENLNEQGGGSVVLVDWFRLPALVGKSTFLLLTTKAGRVPTVNALNTTVDEVEAWIAESIHYQGPSNGLPLATLAGKDKFNHKLRGLVEPLTMQSQPGDVLVFSPTHDLHRIPLHALNIQHCIEHDIDNHDAHTQCSSQTPLIHRNPIVYCHSHSLLRTCFWTSNVAADTWMPINPMFVYGINDNTPGFNEGRKAIAQLAASFNVPVQCGRWAAKEWLFDRLCSSRLIHIQTHGIWMANNPLGHSLALPDPFEFPTYMDMPTRSRSAESTSDLEPRIPTMSGLSAGDMFNLNLNPGTHFNIMACSGALTDDAEGDEVTGLVPAVLYSGASSTVATLWPVLDRDAAVFGRIFFEEYMQMSSAEQIKEGKCLCGCGVGYRFFVNLARVMQKAVMRMDPKEGKPMIGWAGFIMHGYWMFAVPQPTGLLFRRLLAQWGANWFRSLGSVYDGICGLLSKKP